MKKNATPELSTKWWTSNQPDGLNAAADLDRALSAYEAASAKLEKEHSDASHAACLKALDQVEGAAKKVADEATKAEKSPPKKAKTESEEYGFTADALKKMGRVVTEARKSLEERAKSASRDESDEDEDGEGLLDNEKLYQAYLKKSLRRLVKVPLNFAVGLGKQPEEHRLLFHRAKPGRAMMATIKAGTELKKFSFGIAGAHAVKLGVLTLGLEGMQLPGLKKKLERMLKHFKPLPFNKVMLMVDGEEAEDILDPEDISPDEDIETGSVTDEVGADEPARDPAAAFNARLAALMPRIKEALAANAAGAQDIKLMTSQAGVLARKKDFAGADGLLDQVEQALNGNAPRAREQEAARTPAADTVGTGRVGMEVLRNELRTLRAQAVGGMTRLATELASDPHPRAASIAQVVRQLAQQMPDELESILASMDEAMARNDQAAIATHRASVRAGAAQWLAFLQEHADPIKGCETNPWGIPIQIDKPFRASLSAILRTAR